MTKAAEYIELEERYGAHNYHPLDVVIDAGRGRLGLGRRGQPLPGLPGRLLGRQPGPLPPAHRQGPARARRRRVTLTSRAFRNDQLGPFCQELCELTGYRAGAADEHRRRGGRDRHQGRAQVGLQGQGRRRRTRPRSSSATTTSTAAPRPSSASPPRPQYRDGFGPFTPGFTILPYGDADALDAGDHPEHRARSWSSRSRARPASSSRPQGYLTQAARAVPSSTTCC